MTSPAEVPQRPKPCAAADYPVWADGSQERFVCVRDTGHEGAHEDASGCWTW